MASPGPHVLLLSPGAKVGLTRAFADAVAARQGTLTAWEPDLHSPAALSCDSRVPGGPIEDAAAAEALLAWCTQHGATLVVPTRHGDLPTLARARESFAAAGVTLAISSAACIDLCFDKSALHAWLQTAGFPVPEQTTVGAWQTGQLRGHFPLVAKDPRGSGSKHVRICLAPLELAALPPEWILQTLAPGREYTVNVYVDRGGTSVCEVPHERVLVSDGEVMRGRTARIAPLMELARRAAETLPGARGPLNVQIFWHDSSARATVIEINPRFGGGYPLAHRAGARFADWLLAEYGEGATLPRHEAWENDLLIVRYREAMFFPASGSG